MRAKIILLIVLILLTIISANVAAVEVTAVKNQISSLEEASFLITVNNNAEQLQRYSVYSLQSGQGWNIDTVPLRDKIFELAPGEFKTVKVIARPLEKFEPGIYYVYVTVSSDLGENYQQALKIYVDSDRPVDYLPTFKVQVDMDEKINPQELVPITIFLENRNPLNLTGLQLNVQSDLPEFNQQVLLDLPPLGQKTLELSVTPLKYQTPKEYNLFFVFSRAGEVIKIVQQQIEIVPVISDFLVERNQEKKFLKVSSVVTVINEGNIMNEQKVKVAATFFETLFTSGVTSETIDGQRYLTWMVELEPGANTQLNYSTNYRWPLYVLILLLILIGFYVYVKSPATIAKKAVTLKGEDGTMSEIKVTLEVKNQSRHGLREVLITDEVPAIAHVDAGLELGTMKPLEVKHHKRGTTITWIISELDSREHRLITYRVKAKLNILGSFSLPRASVEFKNEKGKRKGKAYSNVFRVSS